MEQANSQIESILTKLNVKYKKSSRWLQMCCPIHGGDNPTGVGFNLAKNKWVCFTRGCQEEWGNDILGIICGVNQISRKEAYSWLRDNIDDVHISSDKVEEEQVVDEIHPEFKLNRLFKTDFYLKRGFSQATLDDFEHGMANAYKMRNRVVFPIRDENLKIRGFSGRWAGDETINKAGKHVCITKSGKEVPKWCHSKFTKSNYLYRLNNAKQFSKEELIIVESIGNTMRFYDAGFKNCVATFGSFLSFKQASLIIGSTKTAILAFDNDKAGRKAEKQAKSLLEAFVHIKTLWTPEGKDWADLNNDEVKEIYGKKD